MHPTMDRMQKKKNPLINAKNGENLSSRVKNKEDLKLKMVDE